MKKTYLFVLCFLNCLILSAQTDSSSVVLHKQIKELKALRIRDSLKLDVLTQEIQHLIIKGNSKDGEQFEKIKAKEDSVRIQNQLEEIKRIKARTQGVPVLVAYDTVFRIFANMGPYNSLERARIANNKIESLIARTFYYPDSLKITKNNEITTISYEDDLIVAINEVDALWQNTSIEQLSKERLTILNELIQKYRKQNSFSNKLKSIGELVLIIGVFGLIVLALNKLFRKLKMYLILDSKWFRKGIVFKNYEIVRRSVLNNLLDKLLAVIKFLIIVILLLTILPYALKLFPQTLRYSQELKNIVLEPVNSMIDSLISYLPSLVKIILILIVIRVMLKILRYFSGEVENGDLKIHAFYPEWAKPTYQILRFLLTAFALIIIFPYLPGSGTVAFQGISVFLGVLISVGSSSAVANAIAGIVITYMRPFQLNDWIKTGNITGIVIERSTLVTRLKTINNEDVTIPNSSILSGPTLNFSSLGRTDGLAITAKVSVKYSIKEETVSSNLIKAAVQTTGISRKRMPYVFQLSLNEINATYEINAITFDPKNMYYIKSDLIKNIHNVFDEAGIPLTSVQFVGLEEIKKEP